MKNEPKPMIIHTLVIYLDEIIKEEIGFVLMEAKTFEEEMGKVSFMKFLMPHTLPVLSVYVVCCYRFSLSC